MIENLKTMTDEEVITVINKIITFNEDLELADLKAVLAEASGRKLEKKYINIIAEKIKDKVQPNPVEPKRGKEVVKQEVKKEEKETPAKPSFDDVYGKDVEEDDVDEKYPVLSFIIGMYKVCAIILLIGIIAIAAIVSLLIFKDNIAIVCGIMFGAIIVGILTFIGFYSMSENIKIKIDIEKHLRTLLKK